MFEIRANVGLGSFAPLAINFLATLILIYIILIVLSPTEKWSSDCFHLFGLSPKGIITSEEFILLDLAAKGVHLSLR